MTKFDMAIVVPKTDELATLERFFNADFSEPTLELPGIERPVYALSMADVETAVVAIEDQGNAAATSITNRVISELEPAIVFLVGTALGNKDRSALCSAVACEMVHDLTERRMTDDGPRFRSRTYEPSGRIRREIGRFLNLYDVERMRSALSGFASVAGIAGFDDVINAASVEFEHLCAGNDLIEGRFQQHVWEHDDRIASYDMESAGFAAAANQHNGLVWMIIRGVSDFGDATTKRTKELRALSMVSASALLRDFVGEGLKSCHPRTLRTPISTSKTLSPGQFYARLNGYDWFRTAAQTRLGIYLSHTRLGRDLTLDGFVAICQRSSLNRQYLRSALARLREEYFEEKYLDYTYDEDIRGFIPGWAEEFHDILRRHSIRLEASEVLVVGCGNGLELEPLFSGAKSVTGVDVSRQMLDRAAARFEGLNLVHAPAEEMAGVETDSIDLYVSLRTYMSTFFNMRSAMAEAYRVLKPGGYAIISIANGFLDTRDGHREVVRGMLPGADGPDEQRSYRVVDPHEPYRILRRVRELFIDYGFENIQMVSLSTDIYIWAQVPTRPEERASAP